VFNYSILLPSKDSTGILISHVEKFPRVPDNEMNFPEFFMNVQNGTFLTNRLF
jgi:hypothetical protein